MNPSCVYIVTQLLLADVLLTEKNAKSLVLILKVYNFPSHTPLEHHPETCRSPLDDSLNTNMQLALCLEPYC